MTYNFDVYGTREFTVHQLVDLVGVALEVEFEERESGYLGGIYYRCVRDNGAQYIILNNDVPDEDGDVVRTAHAEFKTILEINRDPDPDLVRSKFSGIDGLTFIARDTV